MGKESDQLSLLSTILNCSTPTSSVSRTTTRSLEEPEPLLSVPSVDGLHSYTSLELLLRDLTTFTTTSIKVASEHSSVPLLEPASVSPSSETDKDFTTPGSPRDSEEDTQKPRHSVPPTSGNTRVFQPLTSSINGDEILAFIFI